MNFMVSASEGPLSFGFGGGETAFCGIAVQHSVSPRETKKVTRQNIPIFLLPSEWIFIPAAAQFDGVRDRLRDSVCQFLVFKIQNAIGVVHKYLNNKHRWVDSETPLRMT
jgi:hypothetical protein